MLDGYDEGTRVVLDGRLVVEGAFARKFEDGGDAAVATAATVAGHCPVTGESITVNARAERLALVMENARVLPIVGPAEVPAGSLEVERAPNVDTLRPDAQDRLTAANASALTLLSGHPVALRSVAANDSVRVSALLRRVAWDDQAVTYREQARRLVLCGERLGAEEQPVLMAFAGCPRVVPSATRRVSGTILGWLFGAACICSSAVAGVLAGHALATPDPLLGQIPATLLGPTVGATLTVVGAMCLIPLFLRWRSGGV